MEGLLKNKNNAVFMFGQSLLSARKINNCFITLSVFSTNCLTSGLLSEPMADWFRRAVCLNVKVIRPSMPQGSGEPEKDRWVDPRGAGQGRAKLPSSAQRFFFFLIHQHPKLSTTKLHLILKIRFSSQSTLF